MSPRLPAGRPPGRVELHDEDEFACHQVRYGYPADVITEAERAAVWLRSALAENREPFGTVYLTYLGLIADGHTPGPTICPL